jgi:hypothetical protein
MSSIAPRHVRAALAVAAAGCLALTGCSGTPGANGSPTSAGSSSASQSGSPSQSASASASTPATPEPATSTSPAKNIAKPKIPSEAKEFSKDGYEAFVDYWFAAQNYGLATGDAQPMLMASMEKCGICAERAKTMKRSYDNGGWIVGGNIRLVKFYSPLSKDVQSLYQAAIEFRESSSQPYGPGGKSMPEQKYDGKIHKLSAYASYSKAGGWKMAAIEGDE